MKTREFVQNVQLVTNKMPSGKHNVTNVPNLRNPKQILKHALLVQSTNIRLSKMAVVQPVQVVRFIYPVLIWPAIVRIVHQVLNLMVLLLVSRAERTILT